MKALPRQVESGKAKKFQYVKPKSLMLIWIKQRFPE